MPVVGSGRVLNLHLVGSLEKLNLGVGVEGNITLCDECKDGSLGVFISLLANKPPGRLGGKESTEHDERRPSPLESKGDSVGPVTSHCAESSENASTDELTDDPAQVDIGCQVWTEDNGSDVRGIGEGEGLEDTPRETEEDVSGQEDVEVGCKEGEEDKTDHEHLGSHHSLLVTESI